MASALITPALYTPNSIVISALSKESLGRNGRSLITSTPASAVWPITNRAILVPFQIEVPFSVAAFVLFNGATVSGNFDLGVYDDGDGSGVVNRLLSLGSTAQAGANAPQSVAATGALMPGRYYLAAILDNTTAAVFSKAPVAAALAGVGCAQADLGSVVLPSTITLALTASAYLPFFGISQKASV